jgi:glutamyl-tRNA reductase
MTDVRTATRPSERVVVLATHARAVPAAERGRFALRLRDLGDRGAVVIETCHRVEAYLATGHDPAGLAGELRLPAGGTVLTDRAAVRHAITVAVGSDSVVVGEDQILHQLRDAVATARSNGQIDSELERLFTLALRAGRRARSWLQGPRPSLADLAIDVMERQVGPLRGRALLVVGAGWMGRLATAAGIAVGASVTIANRSPDRARTLAAKYEARVEAFDPGARAGRHVGVIVAVGGPWTIGPATVEALVENGTIVVDLSVPPAVHPGLVAALGRRYVSADDLALLEVDAGPTTVSPDRRIEELIERTASEFLDWLQAREARTAAEALVRRADLERAAELEQLWRHHPELDAELRAAIERMTESYARRLLREPLERLARDTDGRNERAVRELFAV